MISISMRNFLAKKSKSWKRCIGNLIISPEIQSALNGNRPIVALESTIITHGMPYPRNLEVAREVEAKVRKCGAYPATIGVIDGNFHVGLSNEQLMRLAKPIDDRPLLKISRRDMSFIGMQGGCGGTTVAATMIIAERAGIHFFATGGIGGVHRGAETSMDISADLIELGKTPVCVVCAGVKSILDIPKTLEVLETHGVPVIGFNCDTFPAFFTNDSGIKSPQRASSAWEVAKMCAVRDSLALRHGMIVAVPNPCPGDTKYLQQAIDDALAAAAVQGIKGPAITPFVLDKVEKLTGGKSLDANIALILNNAQVAAEIAKEFCSLRQNDGSMSGFPPSTDSTVQAATAALHSHAFSSAQVSPTRSSLSPSPAPPRLAKQLSASACASAEHPIMVFGGCVIDMIAKSTSTLSSGTSNPGHLTLTFGGVGRNIAEGLGRLGQPVRLVSAVGDDSNGASLLEHVREAGVDTSLVRVVGKGTLTGISSSGGGSGSGSRRTAGAAVPATATYTAIHDHTGDLLVGIADMSILKEIDPEQVADLAGAIRKCRIVVCDGNLRPETFTALQKITSSYLIPFFFEPTSDHKCLLPVETKSLHQIDIIKPNVYELYTIISAAYELGWITRGKSAIAAALHRIKEHRIAATPGAIEMGDIRVLAIALHGLLLGDKPVIDSSVNSKQSGSGGNTSGVMHWITAEGAPRKVRGKHVLVSMGSRGVLWCASKEAVMKCRPGERLDIRTLEASHGIVIVDDLIACRQFSAISIPVEKIVNASGAGDTFCAGIVNAMHSLDCQELDSRCIESGLRAASISVTSASPIPSDLIN